MNGGGVGKRKRVEDDSRRNEDVEEGEVVVEATHAPPQQPHAFARPQQQQQAQQHQRVVSFDTAEADRERERARDHSRQRERDKRVSSASSSSQQTHRGPSAEELERIAREEAASLARLEQQLKAKEKTAEQLIEERRRERAELLAKLAADEQLQKAAQPPSPPSSPPPPPPPPVERADEAAMLQDDSALAARPFLLEKRAPKREVSVAVDGIDDMFSASPVPAAASAVAAHDDDVAMGATEETGGEDERASAFVMSKRTADDWDDADGYYKHEPGEVIAGQFKVTGVFGKGVFSTVLRAVALDNEAAVFAIKLIRANETMAKAAALEIAVLERLAANDAEQRRHCVQLLARGEHRGHTVMVFEALSMNLRSLVHKYGKSVGIDISAVRVYARQLFTALRHLERSNIVHADIKPDNIVVNEQHTSVKLCDFGSAFFTTDPVEPTPLLVSRFYRAPEVVLGVPYGCPLDMWSVGVVLAEIFTGKLLFPGASNNAMLKLFQEYKGPVSKKLIKRAAFASVYFDDEGQFLHKHFDEQLGRTLTRKMRILKPTRDLFAFLSRHSTKEDADSVRALHSLLSEMFTLDPTKRITPLGASTHRFCKV